MTVSWWGNRGEDRSYNSDDTEFYGVRAIYRQRKCPYGHLLAGRGCINTGLDLAKGVTTMKLEIKLPMIYHANNSKVDEFPHQILAIGEHSNVKFYVCSINGIHPTAYLRIPKGMPLYGITYAEADDLIKVHCGFTYSSGNLYGVENDDESWFLGWDYGHCGDFAGYYLRDNRFPNYHKWTTEEIASECAAACKEVAKYWEALNIKETDE